MHQYHNLFLNNEQMGLMPLHFLNDVYFNNPAMIIADIIISIIVTVSSLDHIYSMGLFVFDQCLFHRSCSICCICPSKSPVPCALMGSDIVIACAQVSLVLFFIRGANLCGAAPCNVVWQQRGAWVWFCTNCWVPELLTVLSVKAPWAGSCL